MLAGKLSSIPEGFFSAKMAAMSLCRYTNTDAMTSRTRRFDRWERENW